MFAVIVLLGLYWLLPIQGQIAIVTDNEQVPGVWPQIALQPSVLRAGEQAVISLRDQQPWSYVKLTVDGVEATRDEAFPVSSSPWAWRWTFTVPETVNYEAIFYTECQRGCSERARRTFGMPATIAPASRTPTKLGVVFADPARDWHGKSGWTVELTYVNRQDDASFSIDGLAQRVALARKQGLRVLVRVAYDHEQSLPPTNDEVALADYLAYCARLMRDDRLNDVYGYAIGSGYNTTGENQHSLENPTTPEWYARVFNGYGLDPHRQDAVVQTMRGIDPHVRVLVGAVAPWSEDQNGVQRDPLDVPWLNYMNTLVAAINQAAQERDQRGIPLARPDGFALRAPGRINVPEIADSPQDEPASELRRADWGNAQAGFRVYRDWLAVINRYETTRGLPAYITATNTWADDEQPPPAQTYPQGWLRAAYENQP